MQRVCGDTSHRAAQYDASRHTVHNDRNDHRGRAPFREHATTLAARWILPVCKLSRDLIKFCVGPRANQNRLPRVARLAEHHPKEQAVIPAGRIAPPDQQLNGRLVVRRLLPRRERRHGHQTKRSVRSNLILRDFVSQIIRQTAPQRTLAIVCTVDLQFHARAEIHPTRRCIVDGSFWRRQHGMLQSASGGPDK